MRLRFPACIAVALLVLWPGTAVPCAMFTIADETTVLFANNEDYVKPGMVWVEPARPGKYARICLGFDTDFAQGAMNEAGLCFDAAAVPEVPWAPDPAKKNTDNLLVLIMDTCASVKEALALFEQYNCRHLATGQFMLADASGDAAVVTWDPRGHCSVVRKSGPYLLITNDRLEWSGLRDQRFMIADRMLAQTSRPTPSLCRDVLDRIHQTGKHAFTTYANVFDLKNRRVYLYAFGNYKEVVTLDLKEELGRRPVKAGIASLFPDPPKIEAVRKAPARVFETEIVLPEEVLRRFTGVYRFDENGLEATVRFEPDQGLLISVDGQRELAIYPESNTAFRFRETFGTLTFQFGSARQPTGFVMHRPGDAQARRIGDLN
jgi:hypothetical protein